MVEWHHRLNEYEFEHSSGGAEGQGSLVCRNLWGCKESDKTEQLNNNNKEAIILYNSKQMEILLSNISC